MSPFNPKCSKILSRSKEEEEEEEQEEEEEEEEEEAVLCPRDRGLDLETASRPILAGLGLGLGLEPCGLGLGLGLESCGLDLGLERPVLVLVLNIRSWL